jgi:pimeloyl-ACP methyl ester carboxylesterase
VLSFIKYGSGPVVWLAFHGIGQDGTCFAPFGERLAHTHTIFSVNLPFHGPADPASNVPDQWPANITKTDWQRLIANFLAQHHIERFSVAGFSMGGRFALITADAFADRMDELCLLAPDGITEDFWFRLATNTAPGRVVLRFFIDHVRWFQRIGQVLVALKLLSPSLLRFAEATMQTPAQRQQIYRAWTGFRSLRVDVPALAQRLTEQPVQTYLILAQFDAVLPRAYTLPLEQAMPQCQVRILPTGHASLVRRAANDY